MRPGAFFDEKGYPHALLLTYTFDPYFFKARVLGRLSDVKSLSPLVIMDASQRDALYNAPGQVLPGLGSEYHLSAFDHAPGAFHPKLWLRLGDEGGLAMLGSGNLTPGGCGLHHEIATTWRVGPGQKDEGGWITPMLEALEDNGHDPIRARMLERMRDISWVSRSTESSPPFLSTLGNPRPLSTQLVELVESGTTYEQVNYFSGSSDRDARVLVWLRENFGVEHARIVMNGRACSFTRDALAGLEGMTVELFEPKDARYMHAKLMVLTGPRGDLALYGSANCSSAAWLSPPGRHGNIEMMTWHEFPAGDAQKELDAFLGWFAEGSQKLKPYGHERLADAGDDDDSAAADDHVSLPGISTLVWDMTSNRLIATFRAPPAPERWTLRVKPDALESTLREFEDEGDGVTWSADAKAWSPTFGSFATFVALEWMDRGSGVPVHTVWVPLSDHDRLLAPPPALGDDFNRLIGRLDTYQTADEILDGFKELGRILFKSIQKMEECPATAVRSKRVRDTNAGTPPVVASNQKTMPRSSKKQGPATYEGVLFQTIARASEGPRPEPEEYARRGGRSGSRAGSTDPVSRALGVMRQVVGTLQKDKGKFARCATPEEFFAVLEYMAVFVNEFWRKYGAEHSRHDYDVSPLAHELLSFALTVRFTNDACGAIRVLARSPRGQKALAQATLGRPEVWEKLSKVCYQPVEKHYDPFEQWLLHRDFYEAALECGHVQDRHPGVDFVAAVQGDLESLFGEDNRTSVDLDIESLQPGDWLWGPGPDWVRYEGPHTNPKYIQVYNRRTHVSRESNSTSVGKNFVAVPQHNGSDSFGRREARTGEPLVKSK